MTSKEKAVELVNKYSNYVHGYVGSSMLTNDEYPEQILKQAKLASIIVCDEILNIGFQINCDAAERCVNPELEFYQTVKNNIESLTLEETQIEI